MNKTNRQTYKQKLPCGGYPTGTDPVTDSTTLGSVAQVVELGTKTTKKHAKMMGQLHLPGRT